MEEIARSATADSAAVDSPTAIGKVEPAAEPNAAHSTVVMNIHAKPFKAAAKKINKILNPVVSKFRS